jgi:very-short-patch-repair endonuclease
LGIAVLFMKIFIARLNMYYGADSETLRAAAILRRNLTLAELLLWKKLRDRKEFNIKFRKQHPINIFIVDFYCHKYRLVIEIDGEIHNDEETSEYDLGRTAELNKYGIRVIRFTNDQIIFNMDLVLERIHEEITK